MQTFMWKALEYWDRERLRLEIFVKIESTLNWTKTMYALK